MAGRSRKAEEQHPSERAEPSPRELGYRMPAEWEPHAATWLAWPHQERDWPGKFGPVPWVFAEIARHLTQGERIRLLVRDRALKRLALQSLTRVGVDVSKVDWVVCPTDRSWTRDFVPSFVVATKRRPPKRPPALGDRSRDGIAAVKWQFNGWARYKDHERDEAAGQSVADRLGIRAFAPEVALGRRSRRVVLEGGAIDVDGEGTLLTTEECLLDGVQARNPKLGKSGTEAMLSRELAIDKVLWVERGIAGDDTGGHIDDFARFVGPATIVLAEERNGRDPNHRVLEAARERLETARDARGRRIRLVRLPMPTPVAFAGQRLPASYANFYIGTHAVLVPTFNDPRDRSVLGSMAELFPDREVVGIHALDLVLGLGTIHCSTQQEPL
jgi:agmatine deiminase